MSALFGVLLAALTFHAGQQVLSFPARDVTAQLGAVPSTIDGVVWYPVEATVPEQQQVIGNPARPLFDGGSAALDAPIAASPSTFPLVMLSHGTGGSARQLVWLGTALARAGFIAVAIDHPGNNSDNDYTVQGFTLWWLRARELTQALNVILASPTFGAHIDRARIGAAGFSLGGYSTIALAGARVDFGSFDARCAKDAGGDRNCQPPPEFPDLWAKVRALRRSDPAYAKALAHSNHSVSDSRVRAVYAIAPAGGDAVTLESLRAIDIPVRIAYGVEDTTLLPLLNAERYERYIPGATELTVPGAHYTFLDACAAAGVHALGSLCVDPPGVDRNAVHARVAADAIDFFERMLAK